ncbi:uncharacterized protein [Rutidosis leptorrhynchoides]|uniref:uncharacterized protein n=1 Tax=Rutidosis leptorrhynchoides TaxID=125765 RepID=UPI003A992676
MSPSSKKSKDKKASKETQKASSKLPGPTSTAAGIPASAYNPLSGTFHALETSPTSSVSSLHSNGRFRNIDETDYGGTLGSGIEYDSVSNNDSWSGESEDHKEKSSNPPGRQETVTGASDNDRREKIRQKNERKHQRQKERRAQELHQRCIGFLMSRKLEALAEKLVAMGFSRDRATTALRLNEGRVEESVSWLFDVGDEADNKSSIQNVSEAKLKIDISEELAQVADLEIRYKCTKQEVERAIVAAEGDLQKAAESLSVQKPDSPKQSDEIGDPLNSNNNGMLSAAVPTLNSVLKPQPKPNTAVIRQQRSDERDFSYTKAAVAMGTSTESVSKNIEPLKKIPPKLEWAKPQQISVLPAEKRWPPSATPLPLTSKMETPRSEYKNLQPPPGSVREPVIVMQRPQSAVTTKQIPVTTSLSSSSPAVSWHPSNGMEAMRSNGFIMPHDNITNTRSPSPNNLYHHQLHYHPQKQQHFVAAPSRGGAISTISAASSLGLFSGLGSSTISSSGASSPVDWSTGGSTAARLDYTSVDWSLDRDLSSSARNGGLWLGPESLVKHTQLHDSYMNGGASLKPDLRFVSTNGNGISGFQDGGASTGEITSVGAGSQEWTSPFEGKDLFSLPRRFVYSPSF